MDPISLFFASYVELVQSTAQKRILDVMGTDVSAISVLHDGVDVSFSYQMWRIRDKSVCANYTENTAKYSKCTVAASSLFKGVCNELQQVNSKNTKNRRERNMYCNAAAQFKPVIANVQWTESRTELDLARRVCNTAIAVASGSTDPVVLKERDDTCLVYRELKAQNGDKP